MNQKIFNQRTIKWSLVSFIISTFLAYTVIIFIWVYGLGWSRGFDDLKRETTLFLIPVFVGVATSLITLISINTISMGKALIRNILG